MCLLEIDMKSALFFVLKNICKIIATMKTDSMFCKPDMMEPAVVIKINHFSNF